MAKRRKKGKKRSKGRPASGRSVSAAARKVAERLATAGPEYIEESCERVMLGSADLRLEKEFAGFYLEPLPLLEAARRHFPRFRRRAKRAARLGRGVTPTIYDDYRIAVLNDLDTPSLRAQLQDRIEKCVNRLKYGRDETKIEIAMVLAAFLSDEANKMVKRKKALPLGVYGLVTTIYEDSFDRAMETVPSVWDIVGDDLYDLWCVKHREGDLAIIESVVERLAVFEELATRLESDDALAQVWKRQTGYITENLGVHIGGGAIHLDPSFFDRDEIALVMDRMERRHWAKLWSPSRYVTYLAMNNLVMCIRETVDEVVSPQRITKLVETLTAVGQRCLESDERARSWVPAIQVAIDSLLEAETPSQSVAVQAFLLQGFLPALTESDEISPHWQRFLGRLQKTRLFKQLDGEDL